MYFLTGFGLFIYQSLDAIDGKQARRTGSSSPLGELFDHGCDSVSTGNFTLTSFFLSMLHLFSSICHRGIFLCSATWCVSMAYVLVLYVFLSDFLLCSLANLCFWQT